MMMVAQREDPPSTSFLRYASSCGRNPPANIVLRLHARFGLAENLQSGFAVTAREFFCLSQWLGAYAFLSPAYCIWASCTVRLLPSRSRSFYC